MIKTPELYELEYLFECEAEFIDEGIPWQYTTVSFKIARGNLRAEFDLKEASNCGQIRLYLEEEEINKFYIENILNLTIKRINDLESLVIEFDKENFVIPLELQTKPTIKIRWGTSLDLQR
ncbi:hypothetical protein [Paenibacillus sp. CF384]|uniref:hypothetical protein n=1 Tax=Paenibacillus sp. CF384 TaxID=1884382 RepID=UPI0008977D30|nr:hypothetical protein [Paenibacillus sp. CF384]SDW21820.1 hypothetical protein SAMN05518855_1001693 [Paenibacillus sp. CF384]